jgi:LPS export ABC transporter protein LptC
MSFRDTQGQMWKGRADQGELTTETGQVELTGNVHVNGLLPGSSQPADLSTEKLMVDTHEDIISTEDPVTVTSIGRQLKTKGLVATLKERHLVLESNVRGTFSP